MSKKMLISQSTATSSQNRGEKVNNTITSKTVENPAAAHQNRPKKWMSSWMCYTMTNMSKVREMLPADQKNGSSAIKHMSGSWKTMSDEEKKLYEKMAKEDETRFLKEKKEFDETGFFTNTEGVHSSKLEAKKHKKTKKVAVFSDFDIEPIKLS